MARQKNLTGEPRAALYIRVSTEEQAMHGLSLDAQKDALHKYAAAHQMKVVGLYADEGVTARKKYRNRTEFMRMLDDVEMDKIDVILFIKLDRWFRNVADYYEVQKVLDAHGVQWISTEERYDTTTANGRLNLNIKLTIAQDECDRTSERIKFVFQDKVRRGEVISGALPIGYRIEDKHMVPDAQTAPIAQGAFRKFIDCRSVNTVQRWMKSEHNIAISRASLRHMLQNERYIGRAHGIENYCPPLIDPDTFATAQHILSQNATRECRQHRTYLFSGLLYCACCGRKLTAHLQDGKYYYYRCAPENRVLGCPNRHNVNERAIEAYLLDHLEDEFACYNVTAAAGRKQTRQQFDPAKLRAKMDKLKDLYLDDLIDRAAYEHDYLTLKQQLDQAETARQPARLVDLPRLRHFRETYATLSREERKAVWSRTVEKIIVDEFNNLQLFPSKFLLK